VSTLSRFHRVNFWLKHHLILVPQSLLAQVTLAVMMIRYRVWKTPVRTLLARAKSADALVETPSVAIAGARRFR